jgi:hypothetical protein
VKAESEAARVIAIKELLDRGYGKAMQPIQGTAKQMIDSRANPIGLHRPRGKASGLYSWLYFG